MLRIKEIPAKPTLKLNGETNPSFIILLCRDTLLDAGWESRQLDALTDELLEARSLKELILQCRKYVNVLE